MKTNIRRLTAFCQKPGIRYHYGFNDSQVAIVYADESASKIPDDSPFPDNLSDMERLKGNWYLDNQK